jgi:hypothetical protein
VNFYEKALFVKPTWQLYVVAERNSCSALRAMLLFAVIFGRPLLPSLMGRSSFHIGPLEPVANACRPSKGTAQGVGLLISSS